MNTNKK